MAKTTINLGQIDELRQVNEALTTEAITPGYLVELTSAGAIQINDGAGQVSQKLFAMEDQSSAAGVEVDILSGATVRYMTAWPGDEIYAWGDKDADLSIGEFLISAGNGALTGAAGSEIDAKIIAVAKEAFVGDGTNMQRITVEAV